MKLSQSLRRLQWRARRVFQKPADNDPLVSLEPENVAPAAPSASGRAPARTPSSRRGLGAVLARAAWLILAFLVTLAVLAAAYVWFVARESRVLVQTEPPAAATEASGSSAVLAAAALIAETVQTTDALADQDMLLAPTTRRVREAWLNDGAAAGVGRFLDLLQPATGRRDVALTEARFALAEGGAGREAARAALLRFNDRVVRGLAVVDQTERGFTALVSGAARALGAEAEAMRAAAGMGRMRQADAASERTFFLARGAALAWRRVLAGHVSDAPARVRADREVRLTPALAALDEAASYQPTLIFNAPLDSSYLPNHLAALGLKLAVASLRLEAAAR